MSHTIKDYTVKVYWDQRAKYFVAEIPELVTCAADGATPAEAVQNLEQTFAVLKEAYQETATPFPEPKPELPITVEAISRAAGVLRLSAIAREVGMSPQTLASKIDRGTQLDVAESAAIAKTMVNRGLWVLKEGHLARDVHVYFAGLKSNAMEVIALAASKAQKLTKIKIPTTRVKQGRDRRPACGRRDC